ncbi:MAG: hypothetical protein WBF24_00610 [Xanthobacteraceae bacterium]
MRTSTETYEHTINGLRQKRAELMQEIAVLSERLGVLTNDVDAINHVLARLGDTQKFDVTTRVPRIVLFYRGQLQQFLLTQLRERGPPTTRDLCERLVQLENRDKRDQRMMADIVSRVGKALRRMHQRGAVVGIKAKTMNQYM